MPKTGHMLNSLCKNTHGLLCDVMWHLTGINWSHVEKHMKNCENCTVPVDGRMAWHSIFKFPETGRLYTLFTIQTAQNRSFGQIWSTVPVDGRLNLLCQIWFSRASRA